jgi:hypothetical protein
LSGPADWFLEDLLCWGPQGPTPCGASPVMVWEKLLQKPLPLTFPHYHPLVSSLLRVPFVTGLATFGWELNRLPSWSEYLPAFVRSSGCLSLGAIVASRRPWGGSAGVCERSRARACVCEGPSALSFSSASRGEALGR